MQNMYFDAYDNKAETVGVCLESRKYKYDRNSQ